MHRSIARRHGAVGADSGQATVELGVVLPVLLILAIAIADFGRIFATGILVDNAARAAAEIGASRYLADPPGPLTSPAPVGDVSYYAPLRLAIARAVCAHMRELPNSAYDAATTDCPGMPLIQVCVHDQQDPSCAEDVYGVPIPSDCDQFDPPPTNLQSHGSDRYVEVRVCYQFTPLVAAPIAILGEFWVQRTRTFVVPCYFVLGGDPCG